MVRWTAERVQRLRKLAEQGQSMAEAAQKFGCTRNAIAGAAFRHDIPFECSRARQAVLVSVGAKKAWDRDDGARRRACSERARAVFGAYRRSATGEAPA